VSNTLSIATLSLDGGGRVGICRLPGLFGDLGADLVVIAEWRPTLVVSMTEQWEMHRYGSGKLGAMLANAGIGWFRFPIRDYGEPEGDSGEAWPNLVARLHEALDDASALPRRTRAFRNDRLAHSCRAREDGRAALARLRSARPGAVETVAQRMWARKGAANAWQRS
jgi:hypothetical protein